MVANTNASTASESGGVTADELPLSGTRVLDFTDTVGVYCGKLLADVGADVIKVELPGGDKLRSRPPLLAGRTDREAGLPFAYYNNNKRGITLGWTRPEAIPVLERLAASADVVLVSPSRRRPLVGFTGTPPYLPWLADDTLLCSITPFGLTGPLRNWRATAMTSFAFSGQMHAVGPFEGPPQAMPGQQLYDAACTRAATMIEAGLARQQPGRGQVIDFAVHQLGAWQKQVIDLYSLAARVTNRVTNFGPPPGGVWQCRTGLIDIAAHSPRHWDMFVAMLGSPEELTDPLYEDRGMRAQLFDLLTPIIEGHMLTHDASDLVERGQALGLPCALLYSPEEFVRDSQPQARDTFVAIDHPVRGTVTIPAPAARTSTPLMRYRRPAPTLGEANSEVYVDELGYTADQVERWKADGLV